MSFEQWFQELQDKAAMRLPFRPAQYLFHSGYAVMDALVELMP